LEWLPGLLKILEVLDRLWYLYLLFLERINLFTYLAYCPIHSQFYYPQHLPADTYQGRRKLKYYGILYEFGAMVLYLSAGLPIDRQFVRHLMAPINTEIIATIPKDPTPISEHWCMNSFQYIPACFQVLKTYLLS
jgi:hypothetical protein